MGWSNDIPNPLVVGGAGQVGIIQLIDAANQLVGKIDNTGVWIYNPPGDGFLNLSLGGMLLKPETTLGITYIEGDVEAYADPGIGQPYVYMQSPQADVVGHDFADLSLWGNVPGLAGTAIFMFGDDVTINGGVCHISTDDLIVETLNLAFFAGIPVAKQTVVGSRGGNAALASLLTALDTYGLITDNSTP